MTYKESIEYIKSLDKYGSVLGLDNMYALAARLDNPEAGLRFIHVTGTNGKGSVCAYLSNILTEAGYRTGAYNSPAVISDTDQITINTKRIGKKLFAEAVSLVKTAADEMVSDGLTHPTRFEVETMAALTAFYIDKCDIVILETGLGGALDATNIVTDKVLNIFTKISLDHTAVLGNTVCEIAKNKAGIITSDAPVLSYESVDEIKKRAEEYGCDTYCLTDDFVTDIKIHDDSITFSIPSLEMNDLETVMTGAYQPYNASLAVYAAKIISAAGYNISNTAIREGLKKTKIPFRFQRMSVGEVDIILDGAHNPDGASLLVKSLEQCYPGRDFIFVTGIFKDKDYTEIARITGSMAQSVYAVENDLSERALRADELAAVLKKYNKNVITCADIESAIDMAADEAMNAVLSVSDKKNEKSVKSAALSAVSCSKSPVIVCFGSLSWLERAKKHIKTLHTGDVKVDTDKIRQGINLILEGIGEDTAREGLKDTPDRVVRMYEEIFAGLNKTAEADLSKTFSSDSKEMIVEKDITFYSMCEHHLMPFYGKAHIAYIPDGRVVGISKLARCVEVYAKKPQIQEHLTEEIADAIMKYLKPKGVIVMLEAEHMCMTMRGVKKPGTKTVTVSSKGKCRSKDHQDMFFRMIDR